MISCEKAAKLICEELDRPLSLLERAQLRFHVMMCSACKAFQKQNEALLQLFEQRFQALSATHAETLSEDACERLKRRIQEAAEAPEDPSDSE
ncbi:MAG: zf-HC2 domain-containing protein [Candidatus Hydrogenedentota bacterium]